MAESIWLALDSSGDRASVAVGSPGNPLAREAVVGARRHAAELLPAIDRALAAAGRPLEGLAGVLVSDGPGSFTGLRVAASVAKALARLQGWPVRTASCLMLAARQAHDAHPPAGGDGYPILAVSDALRGEVYVAVYQFSDRRASELRAPTVVPLAMLEGYAPEATRLAVASYLPPALTGGRPASGPEVVLPRAETLLTLLGLEGGTREVQPGQWEPEYGRPAEAQARWEAAHGRRLPDPASPRG